MESFLNFMHYTVSNVLFYETIRTFGGYHSNTRPFGRVDVLATALLDKRAKNSTFVCFV